MTRGKRETQGFKYTRIVEVIGYTGEAHQGGTDNRTQVKYVKGIIRGKPQAIFETTYYTSIMY